jgi:DNA-binding response OmpR family regulator
MNHLVFVVDGATDISRSLARTLRRSSYVVRNFSAVNALEAAEKSLPSLVVVGGSLPEGIGLKLCRAIRSSSALSVTKVLLLTTRHDQEEHLAAYRAGADDVVPNHFDMHDLVARVKRLMDGCEGPHSLTDRTDVVIDYAAMKISVRDHEVQTSPLEFRLVDYLARNRGRICTRDMLLDAVWGRMEFVMPRSVDACIQRLRRKIEPDRERPTYLKTVRGIGYRFDANATWPVPPISCTCRACSALLTQTSQVASLHRQITE